jgi:hypothetical protein
MRILCLLFDLGISAAWTPLRGYCDCPFRHCSAFRLPTADTTQLSFTDVLTGERSATPSSTHGSPYRCVEVLFFFILLLDLLSDDMTASVDADLPLNSDILAVCVVDKLQCLLGPVDHKGMLA